MKRYLLFAGSTYYPFGGWGDLSGQFNDLEEARVAMATEIAKHHWRWAHIVDTTTGKEIDSAESDDR